ncbi:hypothetical protein ATCC90586_011644 [Pythium insidiosum]|nr:hypothetical protein ATCC90586_011644 [Pythium insidiosum]
MVFDVVGGRLVGQGGGLLRRCGGHERGAKLGTSGCRVVERGAGRACADEELVELVAPDGADRRRLRGRLRVCVRAAQDRLDDVALVRGEALAGVVGLERVADAGDAAARALDRVSVTRGGALCRGEVVQRFVEPVFALVPRDHGWSASLKREGIALT